MNVRYRSSIPKFAKERILERFVSGAKKKAEYRVGGAIVGVRRFHDTGEPESEHGLRNGQYHGVDYRWDSPGQLVSAIPYANGVGHGTAKQWGDDGRLIGTYRLVRGTGIDLWRQQREDGSIYLAEVFQWRDGKGHGFEWWINEDQTSVYIERHWQAWFLHGIEREWNAQGRLARGFPKYHVNGERVTKRQYLRACRSDPTLPPFRKVDNRPRRVFPPQLAKHLRYPRK
jgi:hypothetical protein